MIFPTVPLPSTSEHKGLLDQWYRVLRSIVECFGEYPTTLAYLGKTDYGYITSWKDIVAPLDVNGIYSSYIAKINALSGGTYGGSQPAYVGFNADINMITQGQALGYWVYSRGLGIGNAMAINAVLCGFGGSADVAPGSIPVCEFAEVNFYQGNNFGQSIFKCEAVGVVGNVITYTNEINTSVLGERYLLNKNKTYTTGTATSIGNKKIQGGGGTAWVLGMVGKYFKMNYTDDYYAVPLAGDDVNFDGYGIGHWYKIVAVDVALQQLTLEAYYDVNKLTVGPATYCIMDGAVIKGINKLEKKLTVDDISHLGITAGDILYSPPNHLMMLVGNNFIFNQAFKTGRGSMNSPCAARYKSVNQPMDIGIDYMGPWTTLVRVSPDGSFGTGIDGFDLHAGAFSHSAMWIGQGEKFKFGADGNFQSEFYYDGTGLVLLGPVGTTRSAKFGHGGGNSALMIEHPALGKLDFVNGAAFVWMQEWGGRVWIWKSLNIGSHSATAIDDCLGLKNAAVIYFRDNADAADIKGLSKPASDRVQLGDNTGVRFDLAGVPIYANNAAAVAGGLNQGDIYRDGLDPDGLYIVH